MACHLDARQRHRRTAAHWKEHLERAPERLDLPTYPRTASRSRRAGVACCGIARDHGPMPEKSGAATGHNRVSALLLLAAYAELPLGRLTRQQDVVVGVPWRHAP